MQESFMASVGDVTGAVWLEQSACILIGAIQYLSRRLVTYLPYCFMVGLLKMQVPGERSC